MPAASPGPLFGTTAAVVLLGLDFGLLALAVGAETGSRGVALGVAGLRHADLHRRLLGSAGGGRR